MAQVVMPENTF